MSVLLGILSLVAAVVGGTWSARIDRAAFGPAFWCYMLGCFAAGAAGLAAQVSR